MKRVKRKITAVVLGICLTVVSAVSVYAGTPDAPIVTVTPNTATSSWTNQSATVSFVVPQYTVTAEYCANGSVAVSKSQAPATDTVVVTAVPATNYELEYVVVNGVSIGKAGSFEMPAQDTTVQAHFKQGGFALFDPGGGVQMDGVSFHGTYFSDDSELKFTHTEKRYYGASGDGTINLDHYKMEQRYADRGALTYSHIWLNKEIDFSKYNTLYIDMEVVARSSNAVPVVILQQFRKYEVDPSWGGASDVNGVDKLTLIRPERQTYAIDISRAGYKFKPAITTSYYATDSLGSDYTVTSTVKIYRIWLE